MLRNFLLGEFQMISVYMGGCISLGVKLVQLNEKRWELYEH